MKKPHETLQLLWNTNTAMHMSIQYPCSLNRHIKPLPAKKRRKCIQEVLDLNYCRWQ